MLSLLSCAFVAAATISGPKYKAGILTSVCKCNKLCVKYLIGKNSENTSAR